MSTEKDNPCNANDETALKYDYHYPTDRLSPSSWDDSNEEPSDGDSCTTAEIPTDDRRQSLARVKRRTRGITSPVFDTDNGKDSSDECVSYSANSNTREGMSPKVHQTWSDWDSDEIIFGIENYLNEKRHSLIRSKIAGNQSSIDDYVSVLNGKDTNQTELFSGVDFRCNLNGKLSKIVEVEESKSNTSSETPPDDLSSQKFVERIPDGISNFPYYDIEADVNNRNQRAVSMKYSSGDKFVCLTDENDSDDSDIWRETRSEMKRKNFEYAMTYKDSEYVSSSLKFIFDGNASHGPSSFEEDGGDEKYLQCGTFENEVCGGNSSGEKANESITPNGVADLTEKTLNNASSKETVDLGLENLFYQDDVVRDDDAMPHSGREAILVRESWNMPTSRSCSKRVRGNHTISLSKPDKLTNYLKETGQILYFKENLDKNQIGNPSMSNSRQSSPRSKDDSCSSSDAERLNACNEEGNSNDRPISFRSKIHLDLNLSDNEEKCSTIERMVFGDCPDKCDKCASPRNSEGVAWSSSWNAPIIGKSGSTPTEEGHNGNIHNHPRDQFEIGDSKWNADERMGRAINFPQDRGDIKYEKPDTKPGWDKLLSSLEGERPTKKTEETIFWVGFNKNTLEKTDCQLQDIPTKWDRQKRTVHPTPYPSKPPNPYSHFPTKKTKRRRIKAKKRKRDSVLTDTEAHPWGNRLFDRRGNWLVNTAARREDALTRGKRWFQALVVTRKRHKRHSSTKTTHFSSPDCFRNLFKQIVNIFTVSRRSRK